MKGISMPLLIILIVAVLVVGGLMLRGGNPVQEAAQKATKVITGGGGFNFSEDTPGIENLAKMQQGCPFKDCISSIDKPEFESVSEADAWLNDDDVVFLLDHKGEARAYPQRILNWHEIVNDHVRVQAPNVASEDFYFAVTFCPLCGSALAFDRTVDGEVLEFGVSGKLKDNDLIMYDRQTESLWQQITGEAVVGEQFGKKLKQISMDGLRWKQFKQEHPKGKVLSRDTGFSRDYDAYPYGTYEQDRSVYFKVEGGVDQTIHPKTVVYGVEIDGSFKAYPEEKLAAEGKITDNVGGIPVEITYKNGDVAVERVDTGEELVPTRLFWFAWKAFRPETELY